MAPNIMVDTIISRAAGAEQRHDQADEQPYPDTGEQSTCGDLAVGEAAGHALDLLEVRADDQTVLHGELVVGEEVDGLLCLLVLLVDAEGQGVFEGQRRGGDAEFCDWLMPPVSQTVGQR